MKAVTIWQPWTSLMARGIKKAETRGWRTNYRGEIALHAAKRSPESLAGISTELFMRLSKQFRDLKCLPVGEVVAIGLLVDCVRVGSHHWEENIKDRMGPDEFELGDLSDGRYAWLMENVIELAVPIRAKGQQGLWNWEPKWETFARRTDGKKLGWLKRELNKRGVMWRQNGDSFHAPIIEVAKEHLPMAWAVLTPVDDIDDDDPRFG